jgi:pyrimidine-nucleoside phosphorylase
MNILDIITKKKNKEILSYAELEYAFLGYLNHEIPDYQMSALLMAIVINSMTLEETIALTQIFIESGEVYGLSKEMDNVVDKHSTGGVGDSTTLVIGPMCASLGLHMAKMSGRGLGITGGTIDKLESIPGFNVNVDRKQLINQVKELGFAISSQSDELTPLDKVIYALRDVTGTTESIPLIASSIMSKKIALGAKDILIDVKCGSGALMKEEKDAKQLADWLEKIGAYFHKNVRCVISDMDTPLLYAVGNALEVVEAVNVLHGKKGPLYDECIDIVSNLYSMSTGEPIAISRHKAKECIRDGSALKKFYEFVEAQGGRLQDIEISNHVIHVKASRSGTIKKIDALGCAKLACKLGASKMTLDDKIDYSVGVLLKVIEGKHVNKGDLLMDLFVKDYNQTFVEEDFDFIDIG